MLEIKDLMVFYENAIALNNVAVQCEKGQIAGVFGANSAGKSTLMYTISGIILDVQKKEKMRGGERITVLGSILYDGLDVVGMEASERARKGIILCPERRRIFQESTVLENLRIGGILATRAQAKKTMDYVFSIFPPLRKLQRREGGFLSGGEQQMLAIGRALMAQPRLLLLDEPLLGLSPLMEELLVKAVKDINSETGITLMISEQYARPILPIVHYGYVLENGGAVLEGTAEELMDNPDVKSAYFGL
ncbi:MAG: ATP-binding cassette domain-containing protein [Deltaproteobacteria bacterium]|nr:ATP-binding cassette domain-containing protein [Deltaproteobacteria bacterium]